MEAIDNKKIVLASMEALMNSKEWKIVKSQLEQERENLHNSLFVGAINWNESQIKATIESIKVYDNILTAPERLFLSYGGELQ